MEIITLRCCEIHLFIWRGALFGKYIFTAVRLDSEPSLETGKTSSSLNWQMCQCWLPQANTAWILASDWIYEILSGNPFANVYKGKWIKGFFEVIQGPSYFQLHCPIAASESHRSGTDYNGTVTSPVMSWGGNEMKYVSMKPFLDGV